MAWGLQQHEFPILTPGQMNPFNQALASGLESYKNIMGAAYTPRTLESEISLKQAESESKKAYAQNVGRQMIATVLSNPLAVAHMSKEEFQNFTNMLNPQGTQNKTSPLSQSQPQPQFQPSSSQSQPGTVIQGTGPDRGYSYDQYGNNVVASPKEVEDIANRNNLGANNQNQVTPTQPAQSNAQSTDQWQQLNDAYIAKNFPGTPQGIAAAERISKAEKAGATSAEAYQKYKTDTFTSSLGAQRALTDLYDFHNSYKQAYVKGPLTSLPLVKFLATLDPHYQEAVNDANNIILNVAPAMLAGGKQTDYGKRLVADSKISPELTPTAENHVFQKQSVIMSRLAENASFIQEEEKYKINDVDQQKNDFLEYNLKYKLINEKGELQKQNLNKYKEFLSKKYGRSSNQVNQQTNNEGGFDPVKMLDYNFKNKEEFKASFDNLNPESKALVIDEMKKRRWH